MSTSRRDSADIGDGLGGAGFEAVLASAALGGFAGLVPPVRDVGRLAGAVVKHPGPALGRVAQAGRRLSRVAVGVSDEPGTMDRRFADPAWTKNPAFQRLALSYLAMCDAATGVLDDAGLDWRTTERLRMPLDNALAAFAPTNSLLLNPAGLKEAFDTGGRSLFYGARNMLRDTQTPAKLPTTVNRSNFVLGESIAATPGAVVHRTPLFELVEYTPTTEDVDAVPVLLVPSPVNKFYLLDLEPDKSVIAQELALGRRVFVASWSNPDASDRDIGFDAYVTAITEALDVTADIAGSDSCHLLGLCGGGVLAYLTAGYLAATGRIDTLTTLTIAIAVIDYHRGPATMAFLDAAKVERAARGAAKRGYFDARRSARSFALMRPDDGIWSNVVNNYVLGRRPPTMALLAWAADQTNLTAAFGTELLRAIVANAFVTPGALSVKGVELDPGKITVDTYVLGASADHISPWTDCYRTVSAIGGEVEFVLARGGHAMAIAKGPEVTRTSHWTGPTAADANGWMEGAAEQPGSWWAHWNDWITERASKQVPAPKSAGNKTYPPVASAPGEYVRKVIT